MAKPRPNSSHWFSFLGLEERKRHRVPRLRGTFEALEPRLALDGVVGLGTGLAANYFADSTMTRLAATEISPQIDFDWGGGAPLAGLPADEFAVRWAGKVQARHSETYTFSTQTGADDGLRLTLFTADPTLPGGRKARVLVDTWDTHSSDEQSGSVLLKAGETYDVVLDYYNARGDASVRLDWSSPSTPEATIPASQLYPSQVLASASVGEVWLNTDIGGAAGGTFNSQGPVFTVASAGTGVAGSSDQFQFAYRTVYGDAVTLARLEGLTGDRLSSEAKAGLMVRAGADADARFAGLFVTPDGVRMEARAGAGQSVEEVATADVTAPIWLKLVRNGPTVTGYTSSTGEEGSWIFVGRFDLPSLADQVLVGLAATAGAPDRRVSAQLTDVAITPDIPLGANLGGLATHVGTQPFIDLVKGGVGDARKLDAKGAVTGTPAAIDPVDRWPVEDFGFTGPYLQKPDGFSNTTYLLTFSGKATVGSDWPNVVFAPAGDATGDSTYVDGYDAAANTSKYYVRNTDFSAGNYTHLRLRFRNTQRDASAATGTGLTNVRLYQAGYSSYDESGVFTREWLEAAGRAKVLRFMDWAETNGNRDTEWTDRTFVSDHWNQQGSWEYMVQLANLTHRDLWINIPAHASNDYVLKLAQLIRFGSDGVNPFASQAEYDAYQGTKYRGLDPDLNVYVEYSNEVWNSQFEAQKYATAQANAAYDAGTTYGPNGVTLNFDGTNPAPGSQYRNYRWLGAHLVGDIVGTFRQVFGDAAINTQVRPVVSGWKIYPNTTIEQALQMIEAAGWGVRENLYAVSDTGYFGYTDLAQAQAAPNASRDTATEEELISIFQQATDDGEGTLDWRTTTALATAYGLRHVAYESGPSIGGTAAQAAAQMDERFRTIVVTGLNNWYASGAELSNFFSMHSIANYGGQYGDWAFSDNRWDENQPRAKAFWDIRSAPATSPITAGFTALPSGELPAAYYTNHTTPDSVSSVQNTTSAAKTYRYLVRAVADMDVDLRLSLSPTAAGQSLAVKVNNQPTATLMFATAAALDPAGNRLFSDTSPWTIHLKAGLNVIELEAPGKSGGGSPQINSLKFSPVGQLLADSQPWAYGLPGNPQGIEEGASPWQTSITFQDLETPAVANQSSPFTVAAVSDNPSLIPNDAAHIAWTYNESTTKWTLAITPTPGMTGEANLTITVSDAGGASRSWIVPFQVKPKNPAGITATPQIDGTVTLTWINPSQVTPRFRVERSPDKAVWAQVGLTGPQPNGLVSFTDLPPGGGTWYYRVAALDESNRASAAVQANSGAGVSTSPTSLGGVGLNATSRFTGKAYFASSNGTVGTSSAFSSGNAAYLFDGASTYARFKSSTGNKLAITGLAGGGIDVVNLTFPIFTNRYGSVITVIPPGVSIYYSANDYSASGAGEALDPAKYTRVGSSSLPVASAWVTIVPDMVVQTTLANLAIPAGTRSVLLVFDDCSGTAGPQIASVDAYSTQASQAVTGVAYTTAWTQQEPATFANYIGASVNLTWTNAAAAGYTGLVVQRDDTGDWIGNDLRTWYLPANATSWINDRDKQDLTFNPDAATWDSSRNTPLPANARYLYRIGTRLADGSIVYGAPLEVTTAAAGYSLPTPAGLTATAESDHSIRLTWQPVPGAAGYKIERALDSGYGYKVASMVRVAGDATSWTDTTLIPNTRYGYRVRATNGASDSDWAMAQATTRAITAAPANLAAVAGAGAIRLNWSAPVGKIYSYEIYRGTAPDQLQPYRTYTQGTDPILTPQYVDAGVTPGTMYYYAIRGVLFSNVSPGGMQYTDFSNTVSAQPVLTTPLAPADLMAVPFSVSAVELVWADYAHNETGFEIDRATDAAFAENLKTATVLTDVNRYSVTDLAEGATYYFRVRATNAGGNSAYSTAATATTWIENQPPALLAPAAATPDAVAGTTATLSVLADDDDGEPALTYTWSVLGGPAPVSFAANGTNAAKNTTAVFRQAGTYEFQVTITDAAGLAATSSVKATVSQTLTSIALSPAAASLSNGETRQFQATGYDQFGNPMAAEPVWTWSVDGGVPGGTVTADGLYTAPATGYGNAVVRAASGSVSQAATVTVRTTVDLLALSDTTTVGTRSGSLAETALSDNVYEILIEGLTGGVNQYSAMTHYWTFHVAPGADLLTFNLEAYRTVSADSDGFQFHYSSDGVSWTKMLNISKTGDNDALQSYSLPTNLSGTIYIRATDTNRTSGNVSIDSLFVDRMFLRAQYSSGGTITPPLENLPPTVVAPAAAVLNPVTGTTADLSALGYDDGGEPGLTYAWSVLAGPAPVNFSANGTNAAKNTTATFSKAGAYDFLVAITDAAGLSATSSIKVTVNQTLSAITVTPSATSLSNGETQQFQAIGYDQFGNPMAVQPAWTWSINAGGVGGTVSSTGLYRAPSTGSGTSAVRAASGSISQTATVTVHSTVDVFAQSETTKIGSRSNNLGKTKVSDNSYEILSEASKGSGAKKYTALEHRWTFNVPSGASSLTFHLEAHRTASADGDRFLFQYSRDGSNWTDMIIVDKTGDNNAYQTYSLPANLSGTIYVRVIDTNRSPGNTSIDKVYIDSMFLRARYG